MVGLEWENLGSSGNSGIRDPEIASQALSGQDQSFDHPELRVSICDSKPASLLLHNGDSREIDGHVALWCPFAAAATKKGAEIEAVN